MSAPIDGATVFGRLSRAHATLALLPVKNWPTGFVLSGGEIGRATEDSRRHGRRDQKRQAPDRIAIGEMDEALGWLELLPAPPDPIRAAVQLRVLTSPETGRPHLTWPEIGVRLRCSPTTARTRCMTGVEIISASLRRRAATFRTEGN